MTEHTELGRFLRARRERLTPAEVGLRSTGRRRTPGLRREEVATLAGVSVDYLVRLEQGRDRNPSPSVVAALADALQLDPDERDYFLKLAASAAAPELCPQSSDDSSELPRTVRVLLDRLQPTPAVAIGAWYQILAYNAAWEGVVRATGMLDAPEPNLARYTFLDPRARTTFPAWATTADEQAAVLRDASGCGRRDQALQSLIDELMEEPEFAERWATHGVTRKRRGTKIVAHPDAGELRVDYEVLELVDRPGQRIITWLPADDRTEAAFLRLAGRSEPSSPARLRVIGD